MDYFKIPNYNHTLYPEPTLLPTKTKRRSQEFTDDCTSCKAYRSLQPTLHPTDWQHWNKYSGYDRLREL